MVYFYCEVCKAKKSHTYHGEQTTRKATLDLYLCDGCGDCRAVPRTGYIELSNDDETGETIIIDGKSWTYPDKAKTRELLKQPGKWSGGRRVTEKPKRGLFG